MTDTVPIDPARPSLATIEFHAARVRVRDSRTDDPRRPVPLRYAPGGA